MKIIISKLFLDPFQSVIYASNSLRLFDKLMPPAVEGIEEAHHPPAIH